MRFQKGDWVKWVGGSYHNLKGIVIDTRDPDNAIAPPRHEVKVIWDTKGLGSIKQKSGGSWQRASCLEILSSVEQNDESR
jgi:hypothetical protein